MVSIKSFTSFVLICAVTTALVLTTPGNSKALELCAKVVKTGFFAGRNSRDKPILLRKACKRHELSLGKVEDLAALPATVASVNANSSAISSLQASSLPCASQVGDDVIFEGCNVHVRSGMGATDAAVNGLGNLIVGYDEEVPHPQVSDEFPATVKTGSHNLVVGPFHTYSSHGGFVAGYVNTVSGDHSSVSGGIQNTASGNYSSVSGGGDNTASGDDSSVSGGLSNTASGDNSSISGGGGNMASGDHSSVSGGTQNAAIGQGSSVGGGAQSTASGKSSSVSGGQGNAASGISSSVSGGVQNISSGQSSSASGGIANTASGYFSSVGGGVQNISSGESSSVSGGANRTAAGDGDWAAGSLFEDQ